MPHFTVRPVLGDKINSKGLQVIKILVTIKGRRKLTSLGEKIKEKFWDPESGRVKKSLPGYEDINLKIETEIRKLEKILRDKQLQGESVSIGSLVARDKNVCSYFQSYIDDRKGVLQDSTLEIFKNALKKLKEYDSDLMFSQITPQWLIKYSSI